jgi:FKBP-type peptidyl-prolyl cis-trans isomerase FklB
MAKLNWIFLGGLIVSSGQAWCEDATTLTTDKDKLSYSIGASIGRNFKKEGTEVDQSLLIKGLKSGLAGDKLLLPEKDLRQVMSNYQNELRKHAVANRQQALDTNKKKGDAFLATNKDKEGVVTTPSGVQYKILKAGKGNKPIDSDMVQVNYRGTLLDGTEFDATEPGKPATLKLSALIAGWKEALKLMPTGSKWQLYIPSQLAYGDRGVGNDIGPNETLIFELELVAIK